MGDASRSARDPGGWRRAALWAAAGLVAAVCLLPLGYLVVRTAGSGVEGARRWLFRAEVLPLLARSLGLALAVGLTSALVALPLAWLTVRRRLPLEPLWAALFTAPLAIPSYVGATALVASLGPGGLVRTPLRDMGLDPADLVYGFSGAWLVLSLL
ncbi:MAG: iron ABC transporter permease, partial [Planctomycetota bacterium]